MFRNQKGITLIALVVTIIVLIILATITITLVIQSSLIPTAESARDHQINAEAYDQEWSANTSVFVTDFVANVTFVPSDGE